MSSKVTFDVLARSQATGFDQTNRKIMQQAALAQKASKDTKVLSTSLLAVGAAAIPIAGAATGAMIGLGAAAGATVIGVLGINDAIKKGTPLGHQYQAAFKPVVTEFGLLKQIGAQGMFNGISAGVKASQKSFPALNRDVAVFSTQIGQVAEHVMPALLTLVHRADPLFATFGNQLVSGSKGFEQWAKSSDSVGRFVAYVQTTLPQVEQTVGSLITTVSHIALAAEPFGGGTLTAIRLFSTAINAIPIGTLQTVVPLLLGLKVGNTLSASLNNAGVGLSGFAGKLGKSTGVASGAAGVVGKLGRAVGFLGPAGLVAGVGLGVMSVAMGRGKQAAIEQTKRINELTEAFRNGTVATAVWKNAQETGAAAAGQLGVSQKSLVDGITGSRAKFEAARAEVDRLGKASIQGATINGQYGASSRQIADEQNRLAGALKKSKNGLAESRKEYEAAKKAAADLARQQGSSVLAAQIESGQIDRIAKSLGVTTKEYYAVKSAADKNAQSAASRQLAWAVETGGAKATTGALKNLIAAQRTASVTGSAFLDALHTFAQSAGTAADRAQLIGAYLKASNGDALSFAGSMNNVAGAWKSLSDSIKSSAETAGKTVSGFVSSIINLKTGTIDYNNAAAGPLIQGLQGVQDAAAQAAAATYQHELATKGNVIASRDAVNLYVGQTRGALIDQKGRLTATAKQMGLNIDSARALNRTYFATPKDIATRIRQIGADPVLNVLRSISATLLSIARMSPHPTISVRDKASTQIAKVKQNILALRDHSIDITTYVRNVILPTLDRSKGGATGEHSGPGRASGGAVVGGKRYLVNEIGQELYVGNNSGAYLIPGGPHMWTAPASGQIINAATVRGIRNKATAVAHSTLAKLPAAAKSAVTAAANVLPYGSPVAKHLQAEDKTLNSIASRRASIVNRIKAGYAQLAAAQKKYADEVSTVRTAVMGSFDLLEAGKGTNAGGLLAALQAQVGVANTVAADLAKLKGKVNRNVLAQLAESGTAGLDTLNTLVSATPAQIKQFNALYGQLGAAGTAAGRGAADALYRSGINAAKGLIKGLQSQERALDRQMQRMALVLVRSIRKALGIRSPATRLIPEGVQVPRGFAKGIDNGTKHVRWAASRMAGAAVPSLAAPAAGGSGMPEGASNGAPVHIAFHLPGMYDVEAAIPKIVQGLERHVGKGSTITISRGVR